MTSGVAVSVIVPVLNGEATIDACLASILALRHQFDPLDIIVVDNGSTDRTRAIVARWEPLVRVVAETRKGPAAARNRGVRAAASDLVAFTDADCEVHPDWLAEIVRPLDDRGIGIAGGRILAKDPENAIEKFGESIHDHQWAIESNRLPYAITMSWASRKSVLLDAGGFDESLRRCEDVDLSYRVRQAGYRFAYVPSAIVYHRHERTLGGLFAEGFAHGFHAVHLNQKHRTLLQQAGFGRINPRTYRALGRSLVRTCTGPARQDAACYSVFNLAKKMGKVSGCAWFGDVDL
jgi:glycosyltransferase involved in cell wall biosynthesis